jgi:hypothetical protein
MATAVRVAPAPAPQVARSVTPPKPALLQRCACGGSVSGGGECAECRKRRLGLQRRADNAAGTASAGTAPPVVHDVLRSPGQPLPSATREFFESRLGHNFRDVRVHNDSRADDSARAVSALAYTVGRDVVFASSQYAPDTIAGRQLLAHELTHVVQQSRSGRASVDRAAAEGGLTIGNSDDATEREAEHVSRLVTTGGERAAPRLASSGTIVRRACGPAQIGSVGACTGVSGEVVGDRFLFDVNCDTPRTNTSPPEEDRIRMFARTVAAGDTVEIHGFASAEGDPAFNDALSCARAVRAEGILSSELVSAGIPATFALFKHGSTAGDRATQRGVVLLTRPAAPAPAAPTPTPSPTPTPTPFVCGPNVTTQVTDAIDLTRTTFAGWSSADRTTACHSLTSLTTGLFAWDVIELHNQSWIHLGYRPACATAGATPGCGSSIQIDSDCHYAGSVNYVIFGVMCKLCHDHFTALGSADAADYTAAEMRDLINLYKGTGLTGYGTPSPNFRESVQWADAGYAGWPAVPGPPGDRSHCAPTCPTPYSGTPFMVHWEPFTF